jgi:hypothetical protein
LEFGPRDITMVRITFSREENQEKLVVTSVYLAYDLDEPPSTKEMRDVANYCNSRGRQLVTGYYANAYILWGSKDINPTGESLVENLISSNLDILNTGNKPTFVISNKKEVTDLTLGTNHIGNLVREWYVSDEPFLLLLQVRNV